MIGGNSYGFSDLLVVKGAYNSCLKCSESAHGFPLCLFLSFVTLITLLDKTQFYQKVYLVILTLSKFGGLGQIFINPRKSIIPPLAGGVLRTLINPSN